MRRRCPGGGRSGRRRGRCCLSRRISTRDRSRTASSYRAQRNKYADALFELAKRAAEAGQLSLAFEWATEAVRENPDHADARRVLGYELHDGQWLTPFAKRMVDAGKTLGSESAAGSRPTDDGEARPQAGPRTAGRFAPIIFW